MDISQISQQLDIKPPFLMIDTFSVVEKGEKAIATKSLSPNEWFFDCHLPHSQVMPATLQIEGMLQTLVLLIYDTYDHGETRAFVNDIQVKVLSASTPENTLEFVATLSPMRRGITKGEVIGSSDGKVVCKGSFSYASPKFMLQPKMEAKK
ncbi:3-hydroxyacyl-ACP dehydratase FabZ family protein [Pseudoalteromonas fenneropenaei]|uniref:3-hydroxyacyl-ACP dehydratase FabZ family protein n=1 Tax=Pseudoalteromonas fenneropenaei TaxID=1737459 RepID=A0ABV7CGU0_9GAMM